MIMWKEATLAGQSAVLHIQTVFIEGTLEYALICVNMVG